MMATINTAVEIVETPKLGVYVVVKTPNLGVSTDIPNRTAAASEKWKPQTLGIIINQYKRIVTLNTCKIDFNYAWQLRFKNHIIRNDSEYNRIAHSIQKNISE